VTNVDLAGIAAELEACGVTHVVWVPDSELGGLETHLPSTIRLVRACREGEAIAVAAGLMLGGSHPVVVCQCTGFYEAGDAFRNVTKDLGLPLFLIIGHRGRLSLEAGTGRDSAAIHLEPILQAWALDYTVLDARTDPRTIGEFYHRSQTQGAAAAIVVAE
jgi:sulfopyruvate decarboxylase TPP-binding subunit